MERSHIIRQSLVALAIGAWCFLMLSLASFHATDWPSHSVYPYPPTQNLCGHAGAFVAYYSFLALGQGVFPIVFFSGVCLALVIFKNRVGDLWLRAVGLLLLAVGFAAVVHSLKPGSFNGMPEGHGGLLGIVTSTFLQSHFNVVGARLILLTAMLVGLLLVADDLVLRTPGYVGAMAATVREHAPVLPRMKINFKFPPLPRLPSVPGFVTRDAAKKSVATQLSEEDDEEITSKRAVLLTKPREAQQPV